MREKITNWLLFLVLLEGVTVLSILLIMGIVRLIVGR
jgi:hypothetical protein